MGDRENEKENRDRERGWERENEKGIIRKKERNRQRKL